jgi:hypothetical protein
MIDRVLILSLGGCAILGTLLYMQLRSADKEPGEAAPPSRVEAPASTRPPNPRMDELIATLLGAPLFSETRKLPERTKVDRPVQHSRPNLRLTGIVIKPERPLAIFGVPGAKPLVGSEGDTIQGWRVDSIGPRQVSLSGPEGSTAVFEPKSDPSIVRSSAAARPATSNRSSPVPVAAAAPPSPPASTDGPAPVFPTPRGIPPPRPPQ